MLDTIDLLDAIGQDAALRYMPGDDLVNEQVLADAAESLKAAISTGDRSALADEFGARVMQATQVNQRPGREDDEPDHDDDEDDKPATGRAQGSDRD